MFLMSIRIYFLCRRHSFIEFTDWITQILWVDYFDTI